MRTNVKIISVGGKVTISFLQDGKIVALVLDDMDTLLNFTSEIVEQGAKTWPTHPMSIEYKNS